DGIARYSFYTGAFAIGCAGPGRGSVPRQGGPTDSNRSSRRRRGRQSARKADQDQEDCSEHKKGRSCGTSGNGEGSFFHGDEMVDVAAMRGPITAENLQIQFGHRFATGCLRPDNRKAANQRASMSLNPTKPCSGATRESGTRDEKPDCERNTGGDSKSISAEAQPPVSEHLGPLD